MYVEQSGLSIGLGAANSALDLGMQSMNAYDSLMKEKAKSDMFYAQAQLNANTQEFLRDLEQRNDYENYETYAKQFLTKQKNALQKNIKNNYTAELYSQLFTTAENSLNNTIQAARMQKEYEAIGTQNASAIALNNNTLSGQNAIDANNSIINSEYANGMRNSGYTKAALLQDGTNNALKEVYSNASNVMETVFNNGGDFSDVQKYIDDFVNNSKYSIKMLSDAYASPEGMKYAQEHGEGYIEIGNEIDKKKIKENVTEGLKKQWEVQIKARQEKNMGLVTEGYTKLIEMPAEQRISYANAWLRKIDTDMSGNNLSYSQRKQAVDMFKLFTNGDAATGSGSKDWEKVIDNVINTNMSAFIDMVKKGTFTSYDAKGSFEANVLKELQRYVPDATMFDLKFNFPKVNDFLEVLQKELPPSVKSIVSDAERMITEVAKDLKLDNTNELKEGVASVLWDMIYATQITDDKALEEVKNSITKSINGMYGKKLDIIRPNFKNGNMDLEEGVFGTDKKLAEFLNKIETEGENFVYTDEYNNVRTSVFANGDEVLKRGETLQKEYLQKELGLDPGQLLSSYETEEDISKRDIKALQIFRTTDGTQYKVRSADGKNIQIYTSKDGKNWNPVETKKEADARSKAERKADIKNQALSVAEKLDAKKIREAGITDIEWQKHVNDPKWLAGAIADKVGRYEKSKNQLEKDRIKNQLEALGFTL